MTDNWNYVVIPLNDSILLPRDGLGGPIDIRMVFKRNHMPGVSTIYNMQSWHAQVEYRPSYLLMGGWMPVLDSFSTFHVGDDHQFSTIQEAVEAAEYHSTIIIHPGSYSGPVMVDKPVRIQSSGDVMSTVVTGSWRITRDVALSGITFFISFHPFAIRVHSGRITVSNCVFVGPYRRTGLTQSSGIEIAQNRSRPMIYNSKFTSWHRAVDLTKGSSDGEIIGSIFERNERALVADTAVRLTVERNVFVDNLFAFEVFDKLDVSRSITIRNNVFEGNRKSLRRLVRERSGRATYERIDARQNFWRLGSPNTSSSYWQDGDVYPGHKEPEGFITNPFLYTVPSAVTLPPIRALSTSGRCDVRWTGKQWFVQPHTLSRAVAVAPPFSVLHVNPGTYHDVIVVNKSVTIIAVGQLSETILYGQFVIRSDSSVKIKGLVIYGENGNGIILQDPGSVLTLEKCKLLYKSGSVQSSSSVALEVHGRAKSTVLILEGVRISGWPSALLIAGANSTLSIRRTEFEECRKAVNIVDPASVIFIENTVSHCREAIILHKSDSVQPFFNASCNNFYEVARTITLIGTTSTSHQWQWTTDKNFWFPPQTLSTSALRDDGSVDHITVAWLEHLLESSQSGKRNVITSTDSSLSDGVASGIITTAFQLVQDAVLFAQPWDTVVLLPGVYDNVHIHIDKPLKVTGDRLTILRGSIRISHRHVVLSGFMICFGSDMTSNRSYLIEVDNGTSHVALYEMNLNGSNNKAGGGMVAGGRKSVGIGIFSSVFQQLDTAVFIRNSTSNVAIEGNKFTLCRGAVVFPSKSSGRVEGNDFQRGCFLTLVAEEEGSASDRIVVRHNKFAYPNMIIYGRNRNKDQFAIPRLTPRFLQPVNLSTYPRSAGACFTYSGVQTIDSCDG